MTYTPAAGDVLLTHDKGLVSRALRLGEGFRYGRHSDEAHWNHTAMVTGAEGRLVQAMSNGVVVGHVSDYDGTEHVILRPPYDAKGQDRAVAVVNAAVGQKYGWSVIVCLTISCLTGTKVRFGVAGHPICSGLDSRALTIAGFDMGDDEQWNMPADVMHIAIAQAWPVVFRSPATP